MLGPSTAIHIRVRIDISYTLIASVLHRSPLEGVFPMATTAPGAYPKSTCSARPPARPSLSLSHFGAAIEMTIAAAAAVAVVIAAAATLTISVSAEQGVDADTCKVVLFR